MIAAAGDSCGKTRLGITTFGRPLGVFFCGIGPTSATHWATQWDAFLRPNCETFAQNASHWDETPDSVGGNLGTQWVPRTCCFRADFPSQVTRAFVGEFDLALEGSTTIQAARNEWQLRSSQYCKRLAGEDYDVDRPKKKPPPPPGREGDLVAACAAIDRSSFERRNECVVCATVRRTIRAQGFELWEGKSLLQNSTKALVESLSVLGEPLPICHRAAFSCGAGSCEGHRSRSGCVGPYDDQVVSVRS